MATGAPPSAGNAKRNRPGSPAVSGRPDIFSRLVKTRFRFLCKVVAATARRFHRDQGAIFAGSLSFFATLSLIPALLIGANLMGVMVGSEAVGVEAIQRVFVALFPNIRNSAIDEIYGFVTAVPHHHYSWFGSLGLLWASARFFEILDGVVNQAWTRTAQRSFLPRKLLGVAAFLIAAVLCLASVTLTTGLAIAKHLDLRIFGYTPTASPWLWRLVSVVATYLISSTMFFLIYRFLPKAPVSVRLALGTGCCAGAAWEVSKRVFAFVLVRLADVAAVQGPLAGMIVIMLWVYVSSLILVIGAELGGAYHEVTRGDRAKPA